MHYHCEKIFTDKMKELEQSHKTVYLVRVTRGNKKVRVRVCPSCWGEMPMKGLKGVCIICGKAPFFHSRDSGSPPPKPIIMGKE